MERWRVPRLGLLPAFVIAFVGLGCGRNGKQSPDAAVDAAPVDTMPPPDTGPKPLALDFSATGCMAFDLVNARCDGSAPLTLTFTPVASEDLTRFLWDFGDGSPPSSDRSPTHTYTLPDKYGVTLVAGGSGSGTVSRTHSDYVNVTGAAIGAWCDVKEQCADGLTCLCGSSSPCRPVLARGICTRTCDPAAAGAACPDGTTCADLGTPPPTVAPAPDAQSGSSGTALTASQPIDSWRLPLCLPVCADNSACAVGFRCRDLLAPGSPVTWLKACFVAYPLAIGDRCGDATGKPVDADCASHLCSDLGAFGRCSSECGQTGCPTGTACGHLGDGRNLCLRVCAGTSSCSDDPLLDCEAPGAPGALGFSVDGDSGTPPTTYCAPKTCATSADCGPAGSCPIGGGQCQRLTPPLATSIPVN